MLCKKPYMQGVLAFGCGQCLPCRLNRRRTWAHRIMLESLMHGDSSFVTLTYDQEHLPLWGSLNPEHPQLWLKSIRRALEPHKLRFFLVGEYGDETHRPHYHAAIFGAPPDTLEFQSKWPHGFVHTGTLTKDSAQYIAGYVTKKLTNKHDYRLNGRHPEYARMSLRPGIGAHSMQSVADSLTTDYGCDLLQSTGDVPTSLKHGPSNLPLGRYLRRKLREKMLFSESSTPKKALATLASQMQELFKEGLKSPENKNKSLAHILVDNNKGRVASLEARSKIYNPERCL